MEDDVNEHLRRLLERASDEAGGGSALARAIGVSAAAVTNWTKGHRRPSIDNLMAAAEATGRRLVIDLPRDAERSTLEVSADERAVLTLVRRLRDTDPASAGAVMQLVTDMLEAAVSRSISRGREAL